LILRVSALEILRATGQGTGVNTAEDLLKRRRTDTILVCLVSPETKKIERASGQRWTWPTRWGPTLPPGFSRPSWRSSSSPSRLGSATESCARLAATQTKCRTSRSTALQSPSRPCGSCPPFFLLPPSVLPSLGYQRRESCTFKINRPRSREAAIRLRRQPEALRHLLSKHPNPASS
jgi:hypothetical protein